MGMTVNQKVAYISEVLPEAYALIWEQKPKQLWFCFDWREWQREHTKTTYHACKGCDDLVFWSAGRLAGMSCRYCRGIWLNLSELRSRKVLRKVLVHELLHLRHPSWNETRVQVAGEIMVMRHKWQKPARAEA